jgi:hypothetical protein
MASPNPLIRQNYNLPLTSPVASGFTNISNVSVQIIGANPVRRKIDIINPNIGHTIYVSPGNLVATPGGGSIPIFPGGVLSLKDENINCAWNAIADAAGSFGITILDYL